MFYEQILEFKPEIICVFSQVECEKLKKRILKEKKIKYSIKILSDIDGLEYISKVKVDLVVNALTGSIGLIPSLNTIRKKNNLALANKESLVLAGNIIIREAKLNNIKILPIDSEHSAILQALGNNNISDIEKIYLTASGGPFHEYCLDDLKKVKSNDALKHPTWHMGKKISIDSATMINKGFEIIEAHYLFDIDIKNIKVVINKESLIHSMILFKDNSVIAQLSDRDMRIAIQYALTYPCRIKNNFKKINFLENKILNFDDYNKNLLGIKLCIKAMNLGKLAPAALCFANDILVDKFLKNEIRFLDIYKILDFVLDNYFDFDFDDNKEEILIRLDNLKSKIEKLIEEFIETMR